MIYIILAFELYGILYGFNIWKIIKAILKKILRSAILVILYIDTKSLYYYFVK